MLNLLSATMPRNVFRFWHERWEDDNSVCQVEKGAHQPAQHSQQADQPKKAGLRQGGSNKSRDIVPLGYTIATGWAIVHVA